jgi:hypothetical protein
VKNEKGVSFVLKWPAFSQFPAEAALS